jgi:hypothetical protein
MSDVYQIHALGSENRAKWQFLSFGWQRDHLGAFALKKDPGICIFTSFTGDFEAAAIL